MSVREEDAERFGGQFEEYPDEPDFDPNPRPPGLFGGKGISPKLADLEAALGLIMCGFVTFLAVIAIVIVPLQLFLFRRPRVPMWWGWWIVPLTLLVGFLQVWSFGHFVRFEEQPHPRPVWMALRQRIWPLPLRPLVILWWMLQAALLLMTAHYLIEGYRFTPHSPTGHFLVVAMPLIVLFMAAYASTSFLLFALATAWRSEWFITRVWKLRGLIDITVALVSFMLWRD